MHGWFASSESKAKLQGALGLFCNGFNFNHSSHRTHAEQAFSALVKRWEILWRPKEHNFTGTFPLLSAAMRLHNFAVEEEGIKQKYFTRYRHETQIRQMVFCN